MKRPILICLMALCSWLAPLSAGAVEHALPLAQHEERVADSQPSVKVDGDIMELRNPGAEPLKFEIFSITGQLIKTVTVKNQPMKLQLPKGFYIVKCENWTKRIMLK